MTAGAQLGWDFDLPRLVRVTPAKLANWADCPRRYRMTYLDRPAPARGGAWAHATLGAVVHLALRSLFALPAARRTPSAAAALVDKHWVGEGFRDAAQARAYRERARGWVSDYVEDGAATPTDVDDAAVALEQWVTVSTERIVVEGRADRIDRRGDELVIVDYKTGRSPRADEAQTSRALALYAVAAERTLRRSCVQVELHHLPTGSVTAWRHDRASLAAHVAAAEETAAELSAAADALAAGGEADALFPARPAARCGSCDLRRSCPEGRAAAPEREPWALLAP
ncbi:RecB family exonuclease [Pseudonocardia sp. GCM10023141]|uniref:RecB family exonuclease n=1 Tax=Pseudonocardia sp. GCM10023141 TaxID=3252653 RepID=UPI003609C235